MLAMQRQRSVNLTDKMLSSHCGTKRPHENSENSEGKAETKPSTKLSGTGKWPCVRCSFQNQLEYIFCGICGNPKDGPPHRQENASPPKKLRLCPPKEVTVPKQLSALEPKEKIKTKYPSETCSNQRIAQSSDRLASAASRVCADAALIDYETIKDKENPKQLHYGFAPKAQSQWHWFFVAKKTVTTSDRNDGSYDFTLELDKFGLAQGKANKVESDEKPSRTGNMKKEDAKSYKFTYGCNGAKLEKTAIRKKKSLLQVCLNDDAVSRDRRIARAMAHKEELRYQKGRTKVFIDENGKRNPYFGMPIGGVHHWLYQDAVFKEMGIKSGRSILWQATNVHWKETKVTKNRWALQVRGTLVPPKGSIPPGVKIENHESMLIADQIATKISPTSYHVHLKGVSLPITGATDYQRNQSANELLQKFIKEF
mmetsp:Transcript_14484/g.35298  ORF Transcript_14484/g.35298 Transcript_14484/m.35298 type:complete len:426 (+) Transcript_14484:80-1357(+)